MKNLIMIFMILMVGVVSYGQNLQDPNLKTEAGVIGVPTGTSDFKALIHSTREIQGTLAIAIEGKTKACRVNKDRICISGEEDHSDEAIAARNAGSIHQNSDLVTGQGQKLGRTADVQGAR